MPGSRQQARRRRAPHRAHARAISSACWSTASSRSSTADARPAARARARAHAARPAVRAGRGDHAPPRRVPGAPSRRARRRRARASRARPRCSSTAACSSRSCCASACSGVLDGWLERSRRRAGARARRAPISISPSRAARRTTAGCARVTASASAAARPWRTTSASRARCPRCRACRRRSPRCASRRSGWKKARAPSCRDAEFGLVVGEPVRFRFFGSSTRRDDRAGSVLERWSASELAELQDIEVTLARRAARPGEIVPVRLQAGVTEVGTLAARSGGERDAARAGRSSSTRATPRHERTKRAPATSSASISAPRNTVGSRYVGCCTLTAPTAARGRASRSFAIPQLVAPGEVAARRALAVVSLPPRRGRADRGGSRSSACASRCRSCRAAWSARWRRRSAAACRAAWSRAPRAGSVTRGVDRRAAILPWGAPEGVRQDLAGRRERELPRAPARGVGRRASRRTARRARGGADGARVVRRGRARADAGSGQDARACPRVRLLEEPQAAFYDLLDRHRERRSKSALAGVQLVLVLDVGGGTTDLTLGARRAARERPALDAHRGRRSPDARRRQHGSRARARCASRRWPARPSARLPVARFAQLHPAVSRGQRALARPRRRPSR